MDIFRNRKLENFQMSLLFLIARLIMVVSIPLEGLKSYGDFWNFFHLASLGRPFLDLWVEFPPLFPVLSRGIYLVVGGREHSFIYALIGIFSIIQAANIYIFQKLARAFNAENETFSKVFVYVFFLVGLFYGWAYFDSLAVFCLLLGLYLIKKKNARAAGLAIGVGGLIKWFPLLLLPTAWKWLKTKKALTLIIIAVGVIGLGWGLLFGYSPEFTRASLAAQGAKGSWETVWALIDGNLSTGNFSPEIDRTIPSSASISTGNPPVVPIWLSMLILGGTGFFVFWKSKIDAARHLIGMSGFTLIMFFLWSPGYSPQWTLYLLPLVLLCFKFDRSLLIAMVLTLINLLEWPILLSRGWFQYLDEIVLIRTAVFILLAFLFAQITLAQDKNDKVTN